MKAPLDLRAPRRKRRLLRWVRHWNATHTKLSRKIVVPRGFRVSTPRVGRSAQLLLGLMQDAAGLKVTRTFDVRTLWEITPFVERQIVLAMRELGVSEHPPGSNKGTRVTYYQHSTGAIALAWCGSFQYWLLKLARWPGNIPYAADVTAWLKAADDPANHRVTRVKGALRARRGDRAIDNPDQGGTHIWLVVRNYGVVKGIIGVGGNEGNAVVRSLRPFWRAGAYVRVHEDPVGK